MLLVELEDADVAVAVVVVVVVVADSVVAAVVLPVMRRPRMPHLMPRPSTLLAVAAVVVEVVEVVVDAASLLRTGMLSLLCRIPLLLTEFLFFFFSEPSSDTLFVANLPFATNDDGSSRKYFLDEQYF